MGKYDEAKVVRAISMNSDVKVNSVGKSKTIEVVHNSTHVGNGTWGKIDFLTKYCGYVVIFVDLTTQMSAREAERNAKRKSKRKDKDDIDVKRVMKMKMKL